MMYTCAVSTCRLLGDVSTRASLSVTKLHRGIFVIFGYENIQSPVSIEIANCQVLPVRTGDALGGPRKFSLPIAPPWLNQPLSRHYSVQVVVAVQVGEQDGSYLATGDIMIRDDEPVCLAPFSQFSINQGVVSVGWTSGVTSRKSITGIVSPLLIIHLLFWRSS